MHSNKNNHPSYSIDCKFAKFSYVERTNMGAVQSFKHSIKRK